MYKIIILQEMVYTELYFFHKTDRKSINSDILFYAGRAVGLWERGGRRLVTAVLSAAAIYY